MPLNVLLGVAILYFLALGVSDLFKLHYAPSIVPADLGRTATVGTRMSGLHPRQFYDVIVRRDIFNPQPVVESAPVADEHLDAILIGTSQVSSGKPYAIIETDGNQAVYRVGDTVPNVGRLLGVGRDRVIVLHNHHRVALELPREGLTPGAPLAPSVPGPPFRRFRGDSRSLSHPPIAKGIHQLAPNQYVLDRSTVDSNLKNLAPLFTQIRATPQIENGVANGFLLTEIQPNSIFQQIGLQDGDVLQSVNGQSVGDPAKAFGLLQSLQDQSVITLNVIRNGAAQQVSYSIR